MSCSRSRPAINGTGRTANGNSSRSSAPNASPTAPSTSRADKPARLSLPVKWGRYRLEVSAASRTARSRRSPSTPASMRNRAPTRPICLEVALDKTDYKSGDSMNVAVTATTRWPPHLNVFTDRLVASSIAGRQGRHREGEDVGRQGLGHRRLSGRDLAPSARCAGATHAGARHRRAVVRHRPRRRARSRST